MNREELVRFGTTALLIEALVDKPPDSASLAAVFHPELIGDDEQLRWKGRYYAKCLGEIITSSYGIDQARELGCADQYRKIRLDRDF